MFTEHILDTTIPGGLVVQPTAEVTRTLFLFNKSLLLSRQDLSLTHDGHMLLLQLL